MTQAEQTKHIATKKQEMLNLVEQQIWEFLHEDTGLMPDEQASREAELIRGGIESMLDTAIVFGKAQRELKAMNQQYKTNS